MERDQRGRRLQHDQSPKELGERSLKRVPFREEVRSCCAEHSPGRFLDQFAINPPVVPIGVAGEGHPAERVRVFDIAVDEADAVSRFNVLPHG